MSDFLDELKTEVNGELGRLDPNSRWGKMIKQAIGEIERRDIEIARLREALQDITDAVGSYEEASDKLIAGSRIAGAWHRARAALAGEEMQK
jgi:hypothetical protein